MISSRRRRTLFALLIAVGACSERGSSSSPPPGTPTVPATPTQPPPKAPTPPDATLKDHMREHFAAITEIQRAVVRSNLPAAQSAARYLAEHAEHGAVAGWKPYVDALRQAATAVANAQDIPTAGVAAATLGHTCAQCHSAHSAIVTFAWEPQPEGDDSPAAQMRKHQWAAARLWEGLVGPSDQMWTEGASALASADFAKVTAQAKARGADVAGFAKTVKALAKRAGTITEEDARAKLYGDLLKTCASCHQLTRDRDPSSASDSPTR